MSNNDKSVLALPGQVTPVGVIFPSDMDVEDWMDIGMRLQHTRESMKFYLGDWILFGEASFGEMYAQAIDATGFDYDYLKNIVYVCRNVPLSLRSDQLSFYHHQIVAPAPKDMQEKFLKKAVEDGLTAKELRAEYDLWRKAQDKKDPEKGDIITTEGKLVFKYKCTIMSTSTGTVEADTAEDAEKKALSETKKKVEADDVVVNISQFNEDE